MSTRSPILYAGAFCVVALAVLHFSATFFYLYWSYWWFDALMHFLAGLAGGLMTFWVLAESSWKRWFGGGSPAFYFKIVLACVMIVGVFWEVFEFQNGILDSHEAYPFDVFNDLLLDGLGALAAVFIGVKRLSRRDA